MKSVLSSLALVSLIAGIVPTAIAADDDTQPYEQDFVITAYYSPLPGQCCYVKGGEVADKILNGNGTNGADGTEVKPGMLAAPSSYKFGTRIVLPGIGIGTVHDRGGAIIENGATHRLDVWAGHGEEGLARALAFGVQRVRGTVYPKGSQQPAERLVLEELPAPFERLKPFVAVEGLMDLHVKFGDSGLSAAMLQDTLKTLGYFDATVNGNFGDITRNALQAFLKDMHLDASPDALTVEIAAYLLAALTQQEASPDLPMVNPQSPAKDIQSAQRLLRYLGFYRGRTNGVYDEKLFDSILAFQQSRQLVGQKDSPGAGRIGPVTKRTLTGEWKRLAIARVASQLMLKREIHLALKERGLLLSAFLQEGYSGNQVRTLQQLLADRGFFPAEKINGNFGALTKQSVAKYQLAAGLIKSLNDVSAGNVGPMTMRTLRQETITEKYRLVRGFGWEAL